MGTNNERDVEDPDVQTVALEGEDGEEVVLAQQNVGAGRSMGQGEFPDPDTPPKDPAAVAEEQERLDRSTDVPPRT
jgi:hypothetical protein